MKAIVWTAYGSPDVLRYQEVEKPVPEENELLIRVHAATVFPGDCELRRFDVPSWLLRIALRLFLGLFKPRGQKILGQEYAGVVDTIGNKVSRFKPGDQVFGFTGMQFGAYAEYYCVSEQPTISRGLCVKSPDNESYENLAALPTGGSSALHFIGKANLQPGQKILINGAGGSIGTYAVQLAKHHGAEVTVVDSADKLDMLRSLGADHVIDFQQEDFTRNSVIYDVIFDVVGKSAYRASLRSLTEHGIYLLANTVPLVMIWARLSSNFSSKQVVFELAKQSPKDLIILAQHLSDGTLKTVVDRKFSLAQTAEAHRYVDSGKKAGNVILTVIEDPHPQPTSATEESHEGNC